MTKGQWLVNWGSRTCEGTGAPQDLKISSVRLTVGIFHQDIECLFDGGRTSSKGFRLVSRHLGSVWDSSVTLPPSFRGVVYAVLHQNQEAVTPGIPKTQHVGDMLLR